MQKSKEFLSRDLPVCKELEKWTKKFFVKYDITEKLYEYLKTDDEKYLVEFSKLVDEYYSMPARISEDVNFSVELEVYLKMLGKK